MTMDTWPGSMFEPASLHKYLYANSNPIMFLDPSGKFSLRELSVSMALGALINASGWGLFSAIDYFLFGESPDWKDLYWSLGLGALGGAVGYPIGALNAAKIQTAARIAKDASFAVISYWTTSEELTATGFILSAITGAVASGIGGKMPLKKLKHKSHLAEFVRGVEASSEQETLNRIIITFHNEFVKFITTEIPEMYHALMKEWIKYVLPVP